MKERIETQSSGLDTLRYSTDDNTLGYSTDDTMVSIRFATRPAAATHQAGRKPVVSGGGACRIMRWRVTE